MDEELCPVLEDPRSGEIVDVDVPVAIEAGSDQESRIVVKQDLSRLMQGADGLQFLVSPRTLVGGVGSGSAGEHLADLLLVARLDLEKHAQFAHHPGLAALPRRGDGVLCITLCRHFPNCSLRVCPASRYYSEGNSWRSLCRKIVAPRPQESPSILSQKRAFPNEQAHPAMDESSFRRGLSAGRRVPADASIR